eukprot:TRINITY_DN113061_c0_g1_i1.p1 TRINITY_DN113061_c0_g1~~TRINITY_DN113061_c0_g1_i1.p1  ORF type:complete len:232 (-),score=67.51 TRINITY_DN113061_c0_g1_i1:279-881(-)
MSQSMNARVYVGNLDWKVSWQDLKDHMRQAGEVAFADIFQDSTGRSKGAAIVEYTTAKAAKKAIKDLNDSTLGSRWIFVREDREEHSPFKSKGGGGSKGGGKGGKGGKGKGGFRVGPDDKGRLLYVGNLPFKAAWQELKDMFREYGEVIHVDIARDPEGWSRGFATVLYKEQKEAKAAIRGLNEQEFMGRPMLVRLDNQV